MWHAFELLDRVRWALLQASDCAYAGEGFRKLEYLEDALEALESLRTEVEEGLRRSAIELRCLIGEGALPEDLEEAA